MLVQLQISIHTQRTSFPNALHKYSANLMVAISGRFHKKKGIGAACAENKLLRNHGSFQPRRLIESVQLLLEGTHSQKIQVRYANKNAWMIPLMISRSGESLRPRINVMRTATLSMNHTPRRSRKYCGRQTNAWRSITISSCAILRSPGFPQGIYLLWQVRNEGFSEFILR